MENMKVQYWSETNLPCQSGTTFSTSDVQGEDSGYENIPFSKIYRQNMSITLPSGYTETTNGNFSLTGKHYAIVSNPKNLNSDLTAITYDTDFTDYDLNRLVMNNVASGKDILTLNIKNYDVGSEDSVRVNINIDEVSNSGSGSAKYSLFIDSDYLNNVVIEKGSEMNWLQISIPKTKRSNKFTLSLRRTDSNAGADGFVLAFSEIMITGKAKVVSGISIAITDDEGVYLGSKVTINASAAEGIADEDVLWESKSATDASWTELNYKGLTLVDAPKKAGITLYRAKYNGADNPQTETEWIYSNEVSVTRIQACDGKLSNQLFFENFGTLSDEKAHAVCKEVSYKYIDKCKPVKNGGEYAVVANAKWAGCTKNGEGEGDACREDADNYWFRDDLRSVGGDINGGMLLLNCNNGGPNDILYSREVTVNCPNTTVTFSFFVAQASKSAQAPIKFQVQLVAGGAVIASEEYDSGTLTKDDGWKAGSMQFNTGSNTTFEIRVVNYAAAGSNGNDLLLDNLAFSICTSEVSLDKEASSPGVVVGKRVVAECDTEVTLQADADAAGIESPYFLWVVRENSGNFAPDYSRSGSNVSLGKFTPTADNKYSTYVILAQDEPTATKYFNGEDIGCSPVSVTDTMTVVCSIPSLQYTRECDEITLEALINPGDVVTWFKFEEGDADWTKIGEQTASSKDISLKKSVTITKDTQFKIETVGEGGIESGASTETVVFHNIKLTVTDEAAPITTPGTTTVEISKGGCAYLYPQYTGYNTTPGSVNMAKIVGSDGSQLDLDLAVDHKDICSIEKAVTYYVEYDGCQSNSVAVNILGTVDIELVSRDCNTVKFQANTVAPEVQWYYYDGTKWIADGVSSTRPYEYEKEISATVQKVKASIGSGASLVYSDPIEPAVYNVSMEGSHKDVTYFEGETIKADYDDEITLSLGTSSSVGDSGEVIFYKAGGVIVYKLDLQSAITKGYTFKAQDTEMYYLSVNGCETNTINVVINPEVSIDMTNECNSYQFTATTKGDGVLKWYFNGVEISGTQGESQITYNTTEAGYVEAKYGSVSDEKAVEYHTITLDATPKQIEKGEEVTFTVTPNKSGWLTDYYTELYKIGGGKVGKQIKEPDNTWAYKPETTASYYAKTEDGCKSNEIDVKIKATISIEQTSVKCNNYGFKATITGDGSDIEWQKYYYSESKWSNIGTGMELKDFSISEDTRIRATYGGAISDTIDLVYHKLNLEAVPNHIFAGDEVLVTVTTIPADWLDDKDITLYDADDNDYGTPSDYKWRLYPKEETGYFVKAGGCVSGRITVFVAERKITWPTIFMPYSTSGNNVLFAPFYEEGNPPYTYLNKAQIDEIKIFDRTGNMVADVKGDYWDGTSADGKLVMPGVYYYVGSLIDNDTTFKGHVEVYKEK